MEDLERSESLTVVRATSRLGVVPDKETRVALRDAQRLAAAVANVATRALWRADADSLDAWVGENGRMPRKGDKVPWAATENMAYRATAWAAGELASGVRATVSHTAWLKWRSDRFEALVLQRKSPPHFRETMPLPVRHQSYRLVRDGDGTALTLSLSPGRHPGGHQLRLPLFARDGRQRAEVEALVEGDWRRGEVKVERDRRGRWYARVAYTRLVPRSGGVRLGAINKGMRSFLVAVAEAPTPGYFHQMTYEGGDIAAYLAMMQNRRRSYQRGAKVSGRSGRGRKRLLRPTERLQGKAARYRKTRCQTIARRAARWFADHGVGHVVIEDFSGIRDGEPERLQGGKWIWDRIQEWPFHDLQARLVSCLEEEGITSRVVPAHWISQTCPKCGHVSEDNVDLRRHQLRCVACGHRRDLDVSAAIEVLRRGREAG